MLTAPRLNLLTSRIDSQPPTNSETSHEIATTAEQAATVANTEPQMAWLKRVQHVRANTEDVGAGFAEEARKMHYGETEERNIRGQVSIEETRALLEEGISVMPLPLPAALKGPIH